MAIMGSYDGLSYLGDSLSIYAKFSLGNMGFNMSLCARQVLNWNNTGEQDINLLYQCQGSTKISVVYNSGLLMDDQLAFGTDQYAL